jgi:hypothetical protein
MNSKHDFLPSREADLRDWSANFSEKINSPPGPAQFGLTVAQAANYAALHDAYASAFELSQDPNTRTPVQISVKNTAKAALKVNARMLARLIRATPTVTNEQRIELGLTVPDENPSPVPRPSVAPKLSVQSVLGRTIHLRMRGAESPLRRGKPVGVAGAAIFSHLLPQDSTDGPPQSLSEWKFQGTTSRLEFEINFPAVVSPGSQVWLTAYWMNPKQEPGPASEPIMTHIQFGGVVVNSSALRLAA